MTDAYKDIGTSESNPETNKAIRALLSEGSKSSGIEKKSMSIDKPTFLTAAAIILGNASRIGVHTSHKEFERIFKKVATIGYPIKQVAEINKKEYLGYFRFLHREIISKLPEY